MDTETLQQLGLTKSQAKIYNLLMKHGRLTPPEVAKITGDTRTTVYSILEKLSSIGLAFRNSDSNKISYSPANPAVLERLAEERYQQTVALKQKVTTNMHRYMTYFYTYQEQPGIRFFQGKEGILQMYEDQLRTGQDIYFLRSEYDKNLLGNTIYKIIEKRHKLGIGVHGIEEGENDNREFSRERDNQLGRHMTFYESGMYDAPVNLYVYGNKTAIISFGEEVIGTIIESPQIAEAFRQIHGLVKIAAESLDDRPRKGKLEL